MKDTPDNPNKTPATPNVDVSDEHLPNSNVPRQTITNVSGNYDVPNGGVLFDALNLIEREIFYSEYVYRPLENYGVVQGALAYLRYGPTQ